MREKNRMADIFKKQEDFSFLGKLGLEKEIKVGLLLLLHFAKRTKEGRRDT